MKLPKPTSRHFPIIRVTRPTRGPEVGADDKNEL